MNMYEQVEQLMSDMDTLVKDLKNTDEKNINVDQMKDLRLKCSSFSNDISEQITRIIIAESE